MNKGYVIPGEGFYDTPILFNAYRIKLKKEGKMPIAGLSDIRRPPRLGKLRLGIKKKKKVKRGDKMVEVEYPAEVDYFILDPETPEQGHKADLIAQFQSIFGNQPKKIDIMLPSSNINEVFPQNYTRYGKASSLKCIGDGVTATCIETEFAKGLDQVGNDKNGKMMVNCKGRDCIYAVTNDKADAKECSASATLNVLIHKLPGMGVWQVTTGSFHSIVNINSCIQWITLNYGRAHMLPLVLERRPQETTYSGKKSTHYMLHINAEQSVESLLKTAQIDPTKVLLQTSLPGVDTEEKPPDPDDAVGDVVGEAVEEAIETHAEKTGAKTPEPLGEEGQNPELMDKKQNEFLDGLKEDAEKEGLTDLRTTNYELPEEVKSLSFWEFMPQARLKLKAAGLGKVHIDTLHTYSVQVLSDVKGDDKRQEEIRTLIEAEMEDRGIKW